MSRAVTTPYFTSHERELSKHKTQKVRLGEDTQRKFDQCNLCLQLLKDPVATPAGFLYCRECILRYLSEQKKALDAQAVLYKNQQALAEHGGQVLASEMSEEAIKRFRDRELGKASVSSHISSFGVESVQSSKERQFKRQVAEMEQTMSSRHRIIHPEGQSHVKNAIKQSSFWVPASSSENVTSLLKKPDPLPRDPLGGDFLRPRDLIPTSFALTNSFTPGTTGSPGAGSVHASSAFGGRGGLTAGSSAAVAPTGQSQYSCPGCLDPLLYQQVFLLVPCGHALCSNCMKTFVVKDKKCYECEYGPLKKKDILPLVQAGTAYASHAGTQVEAKKYTPVLLG